MTLEEAYDKWSSQSQNRELHVKTKRVFRKVWFYLPTNKPCSYYTKDVLCRAMAATCELDSDKAKAASVMEHILNWAYLADPEENPKPRFTYNSLTEHAKTLGAAEGQDATGKAEDEDNDLDVDPVTALPRRQASDDDKPINVTDMSNEKKPTGRPAKQVAQIDPETLKVVKVWQSMSDAERSVGAYNLYRAVEKKRMSGGYYWADPKDAETFRPDKESKFTPKVKAAPRTARPAAAKKDPKPSPARQAPSGDPAPVSTHETSNLRLSAFSDDELFVELERRGWQGELCRKQVRSVGRS